MKVNERGSTLVLVLIVILVFSILGVSLMGSAVSERKRVDITETDAQARVLAQSGLDYFESQFKTFAEGKVFTTEELKTYFKNHNALGGNIPDGVTLSMEWDDFNNIVVTSKGKAGQNEKTLTAHYRLGFNIDEPTYDIADFSKEEAIAANFANEKLVGLGLGLAHIGLATPRGDDEEFYVVPNNEIVKVELVGGLLDLNAGAGFDNYKNSNFIASREGGVADINLLGGNQNALVKLNLLKYETAKDTNVLINGYQGYLKLLWFIDAAAYQDIEFQKFAVFGNVHIQQDRDGTTLLSIRDNNGRRRFTFDEGLYVSRSLVIGGYKFANKWGAISKLMLRGDMVAKEDLIISYADLKIGDNDEREKKLTDNQKVSRLYVHGDVLIKDASIKMNNDQYDFGILTKGKMTIKNESDTEGCGELNGLFYAEDGIDIKTNGKKIVINGGLIGDITVDGVPYNESNRGEIEEGKYTMGNLEYYPKEEYMDKLEHVKLTLKESK